jgi:hypothetical protein
LAGWLCNFGSNKSDPNLGANSAKLFLAEPLEINLDQEKKKIDFMIPIWNRVIVKIYAQRTWPWFASRGSLETLNVNLSFTGVMEWWSFGVMEKPKPGTSLGSQNTLNA